MRIFGPQEVLSEAVPDCAAHVAKVQQTARRSG